MRGGVRVGGKSFKVPPPQGGGRAFDPFSLQQLIVDELPVAPTTTPITDDFGVRWPSDTDPRDCAAYPSSPWCGGNPVAWGTPIGYDIEIKANDCETCVYVYPVIAFLKLTPTVFCYRKPDCRPDPAASVPKIELGVIKFPRIKPSSWMTEECAEQRNWFIDRANAMNEDEVASFNIESKYYSSKEAGVEKIAVDKYLLGSPSWFGVFPTVWQNSEQAAILNSRAFWVDMNVRTTYYRLLWKGGGYSPWETKEITSIDFSDCPNCPPRPTPPPPPPPYGDGKEDGDKRKRNDGRKPVCCNDCKDSADRTEKILRDNQKLLKEFEDIKKILGKGIIKVPKVMDSTLSNAQGTAPDLTAAIEYFGKLFATRLGTGRYPIEVPLSLLTGVGDKTQDVESLTDYMYWLTNQVDALVGEFPIDFEIKDIDPLTAGDQSKKIQLPNLAESIAEIYGLSLKNTVQQEVEQAMLLRLATEVIAVKNGVAITQDYVKANTKFLGYRGNPAARELSYNFDFSSIDLNNKEQTVTIDKILKTTKAYIQGWENEDKDTATNFFQKLMFSAGVIKAVFFRNKKQVQELGKQAESMLQDDLDNNKKWKEFLQSINSPNSGYNKDKTEIPEITEEKRDINKPQ